VRRALIAHETPDVGHRDEALLDQQVSRNPQTSAVQVLLEGELAELCVGALELTRRARQCLRYLLQSQLPAIVTCHHHPRQQVQASSLGKCLLAHPSHSDGTLTA
jgi:hypothetical protein